MELKIFPVQRALKTVISGNVLKCMQMYILVNYKVGDLFQMYLYRKLFFGMVTQQKKFKIKYILREIVSSFRLISNE